MTSIKENKVLRVIMLTGGVPPSSVGGAELQALKLSKALIDLGVDVKLITWGKIGQVRKGTFNNVPFHRIVSLLNIFTDWPASFLKKFIQQKNVPSKIEYDDKKDKTNEMTTKVSLNMRLRYTVFYFSALWFLWYRKQEFDILHVHMMEWPAIVGVKIGKLLNKPVLVKDSTMNGIFNILRYPAGKQKQKLIIENAYCVAMTKAIGENLLRAGVNPARVFYIPNGIENRRPKERKDTWNNKVIFVGNLTQQPAKGVDILLQAWKKVAVLISTAQLQIVGDGDIQAYIAYAEKLGIDKSVTFLGKQDNVENLLTSADVFVLPSRREGMSNALMEAMICEMPVIATRISGNEDLIEHKVSGFLVPPADINSLAEALIYVLQNPGESLKLGTKAYSRIIEKCDMAVIAKKHYDLYKKILG
jgi:glycosyltransferase involved in cell wall biosynthesis